MQRNEEMWKKEHKIKVNRADGEVEEWRYWVEKKVKMEDRKEGG